MTQTSSPVRGGSGEMFDRIAERYDLLNRVLSGGMDLYWRRRTIQSLQLTEGQRILDLATGTGDLALAIAAEPRHATVTGLDPSVEMLRRAKEKSHRAQREIEWIEGDAQALPFPDASYDAVTIAFGIRNVPDRSLALREMLRVTKPGGRLAVLELSEPRGEGLLASAARWHIREFVPRLGAWLSGAEEYRYLQRSIAAFPPPNEFVQTIREAGWDEVEAIPLTFGVVQLFVAVRREGP